MGFKRFFALDSFRGTLRFYAVLLVSLPVLLATAFFTVFQRGQIVDAERRQLAASLRQESNAVRAWVTERFDEVAFLSRLQSVRQGNRQAIAEVFKRYLENHHSVSAVVYLDPNGFSAVDTAAPPGIYVGDREYFTEAKAGRSALSSGFIGRVSGVPVCVFSSPVTRPDGSFGGVVFTPVQLKVVDAWLTQATAGASGGAILCDREGRILAPSSAILAGGDLDTAKVPAKLLAAGEVGALYRDAAGREMIGAAVSLDQGGWRLVREKPVSVVLENYRKQALWVGLAALATICCLTPLVLRLSHHLEQPLDMLARYAREMRASRYGAACPLVDPRHMYRELRDLFESFRDMAGQVRSHIEEIERLSVEDGLTGLYNRRFLFAEGAKALDAAVRDGQSCVCLMIDVDHFKKVNDTHGHQAGDAVLAHVADRIAGCTRKSDLVARYGGEEFVVLLFGVGMEQGMALAERIRRALAQTSCPIANGAIAVTGSIGVAEVRTLVEYGGSSLDDLLYRADTALYAAKAAGRNRVQAAAGE